MKRYLSGNRRSKILTSHFQGYEIFRMLIRPLRLFLQKMYIYIYLQSEALARESKSNLIISFQEGKKGRWRLVQQRIGTLVSPVLDLKSAAHWKRSRLLWRSIFFLIIRSNTPRTSLRCDRYRES